MSLLSLSVWVVGHPLINIALLAMLWGGSVSLARFATHLSEVRSATEFKLQHQRAVSHFVHIFALWLRKKAKKQLIHVIIIHVIINTSCTFQGRSSFFLYGNILY